MKKITRINVINNDGCRLGTVLQNIQEKEFEQHFDLKVGDVLSYDTVLHIINEEQLHLTISGVIEKIINYINKDYHSKTICLRVDDSVLNRARWDFEHRRKLYQMANAVNTEVVDENNETGEVVVQAIKKGNDIEFE